MNTGEFRRTVELAGRNLPAEALELGLQHYIDDVARYTYTNEEVRLCVLLGGRIAKAITSRTPSQDGTMTTEEGDLPPVPTLVPKVTITFFLRQIQPCVDTIRVALTGSAVPLCRSLEEVVQWFQKSNRTHGSHVIDDWQGWPQPAPQEDESVDYWQDEFDEWLYGTGPKPDRSKKQKRLSLWRDVSEEETTRKHQMGQIDDLLASIRQHSAQRWPAIWKWPGNLMPEGQPPIVYLECVTRELARRTGFRQADIVVYVLAGIAPCSRPDLVSSHKSYRIITRPMEPGDSWAKMKLVPGPSWVEMKIVNPVPSYKAFRMTYTQVRQAHGIQNLASLSEDELRFYELVHSLGGPWKDKGSKAQWLTVNDAWKKMDGKGYADWRGVRLHYYRDIKARLEKLVT